MKKKKFYIRISVAVIALLIASFGSISIYHEYGKWVAFLAVPIITFFTHVAFLNNDSIFSFSYPYEVEGDNDQDFLKWKENSRSAGIISALTLFGSLFFIGISNTTRKNLALQYEGINVTGRIINGEQISHSGRRGSTWKENNIIVGFHTKENSYKTTEVDVSDDEFKQLFQGQEVPMVYYSKDPSIAKILLSDRDIRRFAKIENRSLVTKDLLKIYDMPFDSIKVSVLDKISFSWKQTILDGQKGFENSKTNELVVPGERGLVYVIRTSKDLNTKEFLAPVKIDKEETLSVYKKEGSTFENKIKMYHSQGLNVVASSEADTVELTPGNFRAAGMNGIHTFLFAKEK